MATGQAPTELYPYTLGLASALLWGIADFLAKGKAERDGAWQALLSLSLTGTALFGALWLARGEPLPPIGALLLWAGAGFCNFLGYAALYRGFQVGLLAVVSTANAAWAGVTVLLSVAFLGEEPGLLGWGAIGLLLVGVVLMARGEGEWRLRAAGLPEGLTAALLFGGGFFLLKLPAAQGDAIAQLAVVRAAGLVGAVAVLLWRRGPMGRGLRPSLFAVLDLMGSLAFVRGLALGAASLVAPLGGLLTPVTVLLGAWFLKERLRAYQWMGFGLVVLGAVLLAFAQQSG